MSAPFCRSHWQRLKPLFYTTYCPGCEAGEPTFSELTRRVCSGQATAEEQAKMAEMATRITQTPEGP